jgi:hypothetical protein
MEDLNARDKDFINEWNNEKHSTTKRVQLNSLKMKR